MCFVCLFIQTELLELNTALLTEILRLQNMAVHRYQFRLLLTGLTKYYILDHYVKSSHISFKVPVYFVQDRQQLMKQIFSFVTKPSDCYRHWSHCLYSHVPASACGPLPTFFSSCSGQRNRLRPVPVPVTAVHYNSSECAH